MFPIISIIGTSEDSKDVTMEVQFDYRDITQYYWRLYDSNPGKEINITLLKKSHLASVTGINFFPWHKIG